ncbi:hypothetical protein F5Y16DRAFT_55548 [Xylariaceae sp. FL0255]|nr:hypothetical protein F5Y16DRAFT_55548 [Xylariaceae sp. FL0255]
MAAYILDDPALWDINRVVQEFCTAEGSRHFYIPERLPASFEEQLRHNQVDGAQLVHEVRDSRRRDLLFEAMGINKFAQKTFLINIIEILQAESRQINSVSGKRKRAEVETALIEVQGRKRRKVQPQLVIPPRGLGYLRRKNHGYFWDSGLSNYDILHDDQSSSTTGHEVCGFSSFNDTAIPVGHRLQVNRLLKRAWLLHGGYRPNVPPGKQSADAAVPLNDPLTDQVLPIYGESDQEYDTETWDEIQEEREERGHRGENIELLSFQAIEDVLNNFVSHCESEWWKEKLPMLQYRALSTWHKLQRDSSIIRKLSKEILEVDKRIAAIRDGIIEAGPWQTAGALSRAAVSLQPSIRDRLKTRWLLDLAGQKHEPKSVAPPIHQPKHRRSGIQDEDGTGVADELSSDSDDGLTIPHKCGPLDSTSLLEPAEDNINVPDKWATALPEDGFPLHAMKRENASVYDGSRANRSLPQGVEIIELSDDDDDDDDGDDNHQMSHQQLELASSDLDDPGIGGQDENDDDNYRIDETTCPQEDSQRWQDCCRFFGHDPAKVSTENSSHWYYFKDTSLALKPYQLYAVYWILTQPKRNVLGAFLADDPGLGKSYIVFGIIATRSALLTNSFHVQNNPDSHTAPGCECPRPYAHGIRCSCEGDISRSLLCVVLEGPQVIICPPSILREWITKLNETLRSDDSTAGFQLGIIAAADGVPREQQNMLLSRSNISHLLAEVTGKVKWKQHKGDHVPDHNGLSVKGRPGQSKTIILATSSYAYPGIHQLFLRSERHRKVECLVSNVAISFFAADECHQYHGSLVKPTRPLRIAEKLARCSGHSVPSFWLGVSGTPIESGPRDIKATVKHIRGMQQNSHIGLSGCNLDIDGFQAAYNAVSNKTPEELRNDSKGLWESFCTTRDLFMGQLMIARSSEGSFQGSSLAAFSLPQVREIECPFPTAYKHLLSVDEAKFGQLVADTLRRLRGYWESNGRVGSQPDLASARKQCLKTQSAATLLRKMRITASFPGLLGAIADELSIESSEVDQYHLKTNGQCKESLQHSPYYQHINEIVAHSPKIPVLERGLQSLLGDHDEHPGRGSLPKNMIVFAEVPTTTYLLYCWLQANWSDRIDPLFIHRNMKMSERAHVLEHMRSWNNEKPVVLVSTPALIGVGIGLQRANHVVLFDVPMMARTDQQAIARVARTGQLLPVHVTSCVAVNCEVEVTIRERKKKRASLSKVDGEGR